MAEHTATPWEYWPVQGVLIRKCRDEQDRVVTHFLAHCNSATQDNAANAEFIVRACNCHDDLLGACNSALAAIALFLPEAKKTRAALRAAIDKARELA